MLNFTKLDYLSLARYSLVAVLLSLLVTPPFTALAELLLVLTIIASQDIRARIMSTLCQPTVRTLLIFYVVISIGIFYSIGSTSESFKMWLGWKKLLLFPIAAALFNDEKWKNKAILSFISASTLFAIVSFASVLYGIHTAGQELGIVVRNHSTQGMFFSMAAFAAISLGFSSTKPQTKVLLSISALLLIANVILISTGRSGYIVMLVCTIAIAISSMTNTHQINKSKIVLVFVLVAIISCGLLMSKTSHDRIQLAITEVQNAHTATSETSMGIRIIFWKNTIELIKHKPWVGYGTGSFRNAYANQVAQKSGLDATIAGDPHNQFMKIIAEHGILGGLPFVSFLVLLFFIKGIDSPYRLLGIGATCAWIATSMANSHFSTFSEGNFIFLWLGMMLSTNLKDPKS